MTAAALDGVMNPDDFSPGLRFAMKTLNTATVKRARTPAEVLPTCFRHNLRQNNADHRHRSRIDTERTKHNSVFRGADNVQTLEQTVVDTLDANDLTPPRRDTIMGIEYVFQPPDGWDNFNFWTACLQHIERRGLQVVSAVVHRDQRRPHMHVIVLALYGGRFAGAELSSGANRLHLQRIDYMMSMRCLGIRPDRRPKPSAIGRLALSPGRGPRRHDEAVRRDAALMQRAAVPDGHRPPSPTDLLARDLIAPTSYCARLRVLEELHAIGVRAGLFAATATRPVTSAPKPACELLKAALTSAA